MIDAPNIDLNKKYYVLDYTTVYDNILNYPDKEFIKPMMITSLSYDKSVGWYIILDDTKFYIINNDINAVYGYENKVVFNSKENAIKYILNNINKIKNHLNGVLHEEQIKE
jgi:hypothetical protein